ncbi:hypothetical protein [Paraflavitalea pollutisoli]|uniref:hypothetical protein n=1 Tax=Paraflavitalea pollutisoli TaxID=3034143 RepID=UPI0023EC4A2A|nr:hypothetical protein [Paraflavitalea sp. H1-2-19X]
MKASNNRMMQAALGAWCLLVMGTACKKDPAKQPDDLVIIVPKKTPVGEALDPAVNRMIGPQGGTVSSPDNTFRIIVPAGAVSSDTYFGVQTITNTNVAGKGRAFRLTPHGKQFAKPVTLEYVYTAFKDSLTFPISAGLSYQDAAGVWQMPGGGIVDTVTKTVKIQTSHFSDWALMERVSLNPVSASLGEGTKQTVKALLYNAVPNPCHCLDDLLQPLPPRGNPYPVGEPVPLPAKYIKGWKLTGPGNLNNTTGNVVEYQAPATITNNRSATIQLELNGPAQGKYLLLSTISLIGDSWIEMSLHGGAPVIFPATPCVRQGDQYFLANPEDEGGGYFAIKWVGGLGTHGFDLKNKTTWHYNTTATGYVSMYMPNPDGELLPSAGGITITKLGNGRVEGTFSVEQASYNNFKAVTTAKGKFSAKLVNG